MICIWDPLPWERVCVCAPDVGECVLGCGGWQMRQQGGQQPVSVCGFVQGVGDGRNNFILSVNVFAGVWGWSHLSGMLWGQLVHFLGLHLQILDWIIWHLFTVHRANKWKWAKAGGLFCCRNIHQFANIPSSCCFLLGLSFQALASFLYKIRRQIRLSGVCTATMREMNT